jgi:futalosine hydrolase
MADILICVSTALEGAGLPASIAGTTIGVLRTGVGSVNAAFALTRQLHTERPRAIVACGVGGAYPGAALDVGDVVCAISETYGDLGAASPEGFLDMEALGFPVVDGDPPLFNRLPLHLFPAARRLPFVTCSTCSGTDADATAMAARTGGAVESMEGAAIVHVALMMGLPVGELRGISNLAGARDRARWRVEDAAAAARRALVSWIEAGGC